MISVTGACVLPASRAVVRSSWVNTGGVLAAELAVTWCRELPSGPSFSSFLLSEESPRTYLLGQGKMGSKQMAKTLPMMPGRPDRMRPPGAPRGGSGLVRRGGQARPLTWEVKGDMQTSEGKAFCTARANVPRQELIGASEEQKKGP